MKPKKASPVPQGTSHASLMAALDEHIRRLAAYGARVKAKPTIHFGSSCFRGTGSMGGVPSDALGVHPDQRQEAIAHAKAHGVPTDYTPGGRPIIRSAAHQKALAKTRGFRNKRGY